MAGPGAESVERLWRRLLGALVRRGLGLGRFGCGRGRSLVGRVGGVGGSRSSAADAAAGGVAFAAYVVVVVVVVVAAAAAGLDFVVVADLDRCCTDCSRCFAALVVLRRVLRPRYRCRRDRALAHCFGFALGCQWSRLERSPGVVGEGHGRLVLGR